MCAVLEVREPELWPISGAVPSVNCATPGGRCATFPLTAERLVAVSRGWRQFARSEVHPFFAFPLSSWGHPTHTPPAQGAPEQRVSPVTHAPERLGGARRGRARRGPGHPWSRRRGRGTLPRSVTRCETGAATWATLRDRLGVVEMRSIRIRE